MKKYLGFSPIEFMAILVLVCLVSFFVIKDLSSNDEIAIEAAKNQHFNNVKVVSVHRWISAMSNGCAYIYWKATIINATDQGGNNVTFTICEQLMYKGVSFNF